ncbi:CHASE3 domain-containing protein [Ditylenchus destructor]|nr:CHASE3 domain-containing protein [Ditylenchus destructor]
MTGRTLMWTFGRKLTVGFALSFGLLLLIGLLSYRGVDVLTQTSYQVAHTHSALNHISGLLSAMKDAETGQRGYLLTGDETYLEPYRQTSVDLPRMLGELKTLIRDNPSQQTRLNQASQMIDGLLALHKDRVDTRKGNGEEAAMRLVRLGDGKRRMDELRVVIGQNGERGRGPAQAARRRGRASRRQRAPGHRLGHGRGRGAGADRGDHAQPRAQRSGGVGGAPCAAFLRGAAGRGQPAGGRRARDGDLDDRDLHHHLRAARDLAPDRRQRAARGRHRRADGRLRARRRRHAAGGARDHRRDAAADRSGRGPHAGPGPQVAADRRGAGPGGRAGRADQHPGHQRDHRGHRRGRRGPPLQRGGRTRSASWPTA